MARIDPLAAPRQPNLPREPRWYESAWARHLALAIAGATLGVLCPFIPLAPARAVCVAVSSVVAGNAAVRLEVDGGVAN